MRILLPNCSTTERPQIAMPSRPRTNYAAAAARNPVSPTTAPPPTDQAQTPVVPVRDAKSPRAANRPAQRERVRTAPIRVTLDLPPADHAALKRWCNRAAVTADLPGVALAPVLRLLGAELLRDDKLASRIIGHLLEQAETIL